VYVPGPVPPDAPVVEIVVAWFTSTGFTVADTVPADNAGSTVNMNDVAAVFPFPSVTVSVTVYGELEWSLGVQLIEPEFELLHPSGSPVHAYV
jgi:2',3'-cyclic-nucleotide 2'-phosphodiesterase (5'-nucleotidase family)